MALENKVAVGATAADSRLSHGMGGASFATSRVA